MSELIESTCFEISNGINKNVASGVGKLTENLNGKIVSFSEADSVARSDASVMKQRESITDVIQFFKTNRIISDDMQSVLFVGPYDNSDEE